MKQLESWKEIQYLCLPLDALLARQGGLVALLLLPGLVVGEGIFQLHRH